MVAQAGGAGSAQRPGGDRPDGGAGRRRVTDAAALHHARVYEVLMEQELEAPPDALVVALATRIREQSASAVAAPAPSAAPQTPIPGTESCRSGARARGERPAWAGGRRRAGFGRAESRTNACRRPRGAPDAPCRPVRAPVPRPGISAKLRFRGPPRCRSEGLALVGPGVAGLAGITLAAAAALYRSAAPPALRIGRVSRLTAEPGIEVPPLALARRKVRRLAAGPSGRLRIYVRQLAGGRTIPVAEDLGGDQHWPRWSPDGARLSLETDRAIYVVPALGGDPKLLVAAAPGPLVNGEGAVSNEGPGYLAWSPDGRRIAYAVGRDIDIRGAERRPSHAGGQHGSAALVRLVTRRQPAGVRRRQRGLRVRTRRHRQHRAQLDLDGLHGRRLASTGHRRRVAQHLSGAGCRTAEASCSSPTATEVGISTGSDWIGRVAPPGLRRGSRPGSTCTGSRSRATAPCWSTPTSPTTPTSGRWRFPRPERSPRPGRPRSRRDTSPSRVWRSRPTAGGWHSIPIGAATRRSIGSRYPAVSRSSCRSMPATTSCRPGRRMAASWRTTGSGTGADASS